MESVLRDLYTNKPPQTRKGGFETAWRMSSNLDSNQKTETELAFWYVLLYFVDSEPFQSKQKQKQVCTSHNSRFDHL